MRLLALVVTLISLLGAADSPASMYKKARKAQEKGNYTDAYVFASQAVALAPDNREYWAFSQAVRTRGLAGMKLQSGPAGASAAAEPESIVSEITEGDLREAREVVPPPVLRGAPGVKSFNLRGDSKKLFEDVCAQFGLKVVFDGDYQPSRPMAFVAEGLDYRQALRALESMTGSFIVAVNEKVALVAKDTTQKRTEIEPVASVVVPFPEPLTPQDMQEAARAVQSTFDMTKMGLDNGRRMVLFRDRISRLKPALELFQQLMVLRAQVHTEIELLTISSNSTMNYGAKLQTSVPFTWLGNPTPFTVTNPLASGQWLPTFGGGKTLIGVGITGTSLFASASRGQSTSLMKAELRGLDGQPSQLHIGDRYPILTAGYYGDTSGGGTVFRPPPSVNFEDLGIVLKVTPHVHGMDSVTLEIEAEFKTLSGQAENGIPVISNRKFATRVRMNFEETAIVAGLVQSTISQSWNGIPLLAAVPGLRVNDKTRDFNQVLLTLKPRLTNMPPSEFLTWPVRAGSETRPLTPLE